MTLATHFLAALGASALPAGAREGLARALTAAIARAHRAWPDVRIDDAEFVRHVSRFCGPGDPVASLERMDAGGMYLACACLRHDEAAIRALRRGYNPRLERVLHRFEAQGLKDEILQHVYSLLLLATERRVATLAKYDGRGDLGNWLVVIARREGARLAKRKAAREVREQVAGGALELGRRLRDPDIDRLKARYGAEFTRAFEEAFAALSPRERNLFRYQYLDRLSLEAMARLHDVSRATIARWRDRARRRLFEETRSRLQARLNLDDAELDSIMAAIDSELEVSLSRVFASTRPP